ncbi:sensor histidine kinase [Desulfobacca acetoxidans]|uniref:histidine kinase n=1 Tax=Desulfobacca acetoxidans (strain ATCC 700848 / DSM 11109 / ASRB2) TaxID=880072 RepID=F2NHZ1_DESAR|nr:sensor histidine kinase [Desulfobacca acetoxidans]AEB09617.1 multi-sensor signal transduction histidine kinase [Desulfobacca acetoxidans DSM 11109]
MRLVSTKVYVIVGVITFLVLVGAFILGLMSADKMREVISEQFNQQQLVIAQGAASDIEDKFRFIQNELHTLNLSPSIQYLEVSWPNRMQITMDTVRDLGVVEIGFLNAAGSQLNQLTANNRSSVKKVDFANLGWLSWIRDPGHLNKFLLEQVGADLRSSPDDNAYLLIAIPTYQVSVDESHPVASRQFTGTLYFLLNPSSFVKKFVQNLRSGQTGYAWVIDGRGFFLYHPEEEFIGKNAFEVRRKRSHFTISFSEINKIQREKMLAGREGASWYWSGWHRGIEQKMKKFIAFAPIHLKGDNEQLIWSLAVVAPQAEVEGVIHEVYLRQFLLQGGIIILILMAGGVIIFYESRWSAALEMEVQRKTAALKKSTDELEKSEKLYKSLVESAEDSILTVDIHKEIVSINRFGAKFFGYTPRGIIGKSLAAILPGSANVTLGHQIDDVFQTQTGRRVFLEVVLGGKEYHLNINLTPIIEGEQVVSVLLIAHDVTMARKMEEQLYFTEKLASLGQLAAGVAHEINNPLAIILGYTDMLLEKTEADSKQYKILQTIERQGNNCKRIVENLMTFARAPEEVQHDTDVNRNIEMVLEVVRNTLFTRKIEYQLELEERLPRVNGDAAQLQQVFLNLITNAVKAMPEGGRLTIATRSLKNGAEVQILFIDTGVGIKKEHLPKIYDPFFTTRKVGEGTGLGLSVSYGIITKFGGSINCVSKAQEEVGKEESGSTFTITLPAAQNNRGESTV